jgi:nicotinamidase-related amidase
VDGVRQETALIVIALQLGFTEVTYPSGGDLDRVVASCKELVAAAHQENIPVFLTESKNTAT